jgi:hypothetical protein
MVTESRAATWAFNHRNVQNGKERNDERSDEDNLDTRRHCRCGSAALGRAAGLVLGVSQLRGRTGSPLALLVVCFLPVLVVAGWVLLAMQPHPNWFRSHALSWSGDLGIRGVILDVGTWLGVLALGIGYTLGVVLEPAPRRQVVTTPESVPPIARDQPVPVEPVPAEPREVAPATSREEVPAQ